MRRDSEYPFMLPRQPEKRPLLFCKFQLPNDHFTCVTRNTRVRSALRLHPRDKRSFYPLLPFSRHSRPLEDMFTRRLVFFLFFLFSVVFPLEKGQSTSLIRFLAEGEASTPELGCFLTNRVSRQQNLGQIVLCV